MMHSLKKTVPMLLGIAAIVACSDSTLVGPAKASPVGSYTGTVLVFTDATGPTDQISLGGTLLINLAANGATSGHLHVAASGGQPVFDADMVGTWSQNGESIEFAQAADTFMKDMTFTIQRTSTSVTALVGNLVLSQGRIDLTLAHD